jgi:hypothetical protein
LPPQPGGDSARSSTVRPSPSASISASITRRQLP